MRRNLTGSISARSKVRIRSDLPPHKTGRWPHSIVCFMFQQFLGIVDPGDRQQTSASENCPNIDNSLSCKTETPCQPLVPQPRGLALLWSAQAVGAESGRIRWGEGEDPQRRARPGCIVFGVECPVPEGHPFSFYSSTGSTRQIELSHHPM